MFRLSVLIISFLISNLAHALPRNFDLQWLRGEGFGERKVDSGETLVYCKTTAENVRFCRANNGALIKESKSCSVLGSRLIPERLYLAIINSNENFPWRFSAGRLNRCEWGDTPPDTFLTTLKSADGTVLTWESSAFRSETPNKVSYCQADSATLIAEHGEKANGELIIDFKFTEKGVVSDSGELRFPIRVYDQTGKQRVQDRSDSYCDDLGDICSGYAGECRF